MLLSESQVKRFWSKRADKPGWPVIVAVHGWSPSEAERERKAMLARCGFTSLTLVDPNEGFTAVLHEMAILLDDTKGILYADANPRRVLLHTIKTLTKKISLSKVEGAPLNSGYLGALMLDRYGHQDIDRLDNTELEKLRFTLADRLVQDHSPATKARRSAINRARRAQPRPEPRLKLAPDTAEPCGGYYCSEDHGHIDCQARLDELNAQPAIDDNEGGVQF